MVAFLVILDTQEAEAGVCFVLVMYGWEWGKHGLLNTDSRSPYELTETEAARTGPSWFSTRWVLELRGEVDIPRPEASSR